MNDKFIYKKINMLKGKKITQINGLVFKTYHHISLLTKFKNTLINLNPSHL